MTLKEINDRLVIMGKFHSLDSHRSKDALMASHFATFIADGEILLTD